MSARDKLLALFPHLPHLDASNRALIEVAVDEILSDHAHELAEKIRNSEWLRDLTDDHMGDCNAAADLIDPKEANDCG